MNFFEAQTRAKNNTKKLFAMFILALLGLVLMSNFMVFSSIILISKDSGMITFAHIKSQLNWPVFWILSLTVITIVFVASIAKIISLRRGGYVVPESLGGSLVKHTNQDAQYKILLNVVEEIAIASGTRVPQVYVLKEETCINAFASGFNKDDAVLGVTQGAVDHLDRDELQGVIAHEFSHIVNGDMRMNIHLTGILHGIILINLWGHKILRTSSPRPRGKSFLGLVGVILVGSGGLGALFGRAIKATISQQREFLADASAVQFTRNNSGIAKALIKIGAQSAGAALKSSNAETISHALFANGHSRLGIFWLDTHPPLDERIKKIDSAWSGKLKKKPSNINLLDGTHQPDNNTTATTHNFNIVESKQTAASVDEINSQSLLESVGQLDASSIILAQECLAGIDKSLIDLVHSEQGAEAFIYAVLAAPCSALEEFENDENGDSSDFFETPSGQLVVLQCALPYQFSKLVAKAYHGLSDLAIQHRLPLIDIALPQLANMSHKAYQQMLERIDTLIFVDNKLDIYEWAISNIVKQYLHSKFGNAHQKSHTSQSLSKFQPQMSTLVSTLIHEFCDSSEHVSVVVHLNSLLDDCVLSLVPQQALTIDAFADAVQALNNSSLQSKQKLLLVCMYAVTQDQHLSVREYETIRAIADCIECPMPIRRR